MGLKPISLPVNDDSRPHNQLNEPGRYLLRGARHPTFGRKSFGLKKTCQMLIAHSPTDSVPDGQTPHKAPCKSDPGGFQGCIPNPPLI